MSKLYHDSDRLSMELMIKFREGTLTAEEEARLNALQAQDPFIADALEGMAVVSDENTFANDVEDLRSRIKQRTNTKKGIRVFWLPVAASLVLLIGAFYAVYTYVQPSDTSSFISKEAAPSASAPEEAIEVPSELSPISALPPEDLADTPSPDENQSPQSLALVQLSPEVNVLPLEILQESASERPVEMTTGGDAESDEVPLVFSEVEAEAFDEEYSLGKKSKVSGDEKLPSTLSYDKARFRAASPAVASEVKQGWRMIRGQIIDKESGNPIAGANVIVKDTILGTVTDLDGRFALVLPEQYKKLEVASIGYLSSEVNIQKQDTTLVALDQDVQSLSEVVVTVYGSNEHTQEVSPIAAKPHHGMRAFKQYLRDNQRHPDHWKEGDKAVVKLSFFVQQNGETTDFTIEKSAGDWLDQEAIRLIQEGPTWEAATRNDQPISQQVKLRLRFKK